MSSLLGRAKPRAWGRAEAQRKRKMTSKPEGKEVTPATLAETLTYIEVRGKSIKFASDKLRAAHVQIQTWVAEQIHASGVHPTLTRLPVDAGRETVWRLGGSGGGAFIGRMYSWWEGERGEVDTGAEYVPRNVLVAGTRLLPGHLAAYAEKLRAAEQEYEAVAALAAEMAKLLPAKAAA